MYRNMNKRLFAFIIALIGLCVVCSVFVFVMKNAADKPVEAIIYVNNEVYLRVNLYDESYSDYKIETEYGMNKITVSDGKICVSDSDCPDRICVNMGYTADFSKPIICMPHRLEIVISGDRLDGAAR